MRFELSFLERGYYANLLRARAQHVRELVENRSASATVQELREEAAYLEGQALRLDDALEPKPASTAEPIQAGGNRDVEYISGAGANTNGKTHA